MPVEQRFSFLNLTGTPSAVSSVGKIAGSNNVNDQFCGVANLGAGSASATVLGVRITSDTAIFLGSMTPTYTAVTSGHTSRAFTVTSLTSTVMSADGSRVNTGGFIITTMDGLAASSVSAIKVPFMVWNIRQ